MSLEYLETVVRDLYEEESERADKLDAAVNLPTAIVTALLSVGGLFLEKFPRGNGNFLVIVFYVGFLGYIYFVVAAIWCLIRSYSGHKYRLLASPQTIICFANDSRAYYQAQKSEELESEEIDAKVKRDVQENLVRQFSEAGEQNRERNLERISWLISARQHIIVAVVILFGSKILFSLVQETAPKPQEVKIISVPETLHWIAPQKGRLSLP